MHRLLSQFSEIAGRLASDSQNVRQFRRYFIVGLSNGVASYFFLILLYDLQSAHASRGALAQAGASAVVVVWSYFWNRCWSFSSASRIGWEGTKFLVGQALIFGLGVALMGLMVDVLALSLTLSWIAMNGVVIVTNFSLLKLWVFSEQP